MQQPVNLTVFVTEYAANAVKKKVKQFLQSDIHILMNGQQLQRQRAQKTERKLMSAQNAEQGLMSRRFLQPIMILAEIGWLKKLQPVLKKVLNIESVYTVMYKKQEVRKKQHIIMY